MANVSIFGVLSNIQMLIKTAFGGKKVGVDQYGNVYYTGKPRAGTKLERRWVMYNGEVEASRVPPEWHGWLHHQTDALPASAAAGKFRKPWQRSWQPNMTATDKAYFPPGDTRSRGYRDAATGDYQAWQPPK